MDEKKWSCMDHKKNWALKNWCFWTVVLEKTLENPLDSKKIKPVNRKGNQSWRFIGQTTVHWTNAKVEAPVLWLCDAKNCLSEKDPDWRWEEKGAIEDEMVKWHYQLDLHEFEQGPGVGDGWEAWHAAVPGLSEYDSIELLNWTEFPIPIWKFGNF